MVNPLRALIVDDEPAARHGIRHLLDADPEILVVGESCDGRQAVRDIESLRPDLVLLDIQIPCLNGFEVLARVSLARPPGIIFVTAYDRYAIRAFDVHAVDYLLKPFTDRRLREALECAKLNMYAQSVADIRERMDAALQACGRAQDGFHGGGHSSRLVVREAERLLLLDVEKIRWIEAAEDYAEVHTLDRTYLVRQTMQSLQALLDPKRFVRIHRSILVNLAEILELRPRSRGEFVVVLNDSTRLHLSRRRREDLARALGQPL